MEGKKQVDRFFRSSDRAPKKKKKVLKFSSQVDIKWNQFRIEKFHDDER